MSDGWNYTLGLNPSGFVQGAQQAQGAQKALTDGIREGAQRAAEAQRAMTTAITQAAAEAQEAQRRMTWQFGQASQSHAQALNLEMNLLRRSAQESGAAAVEKEKLTKSNRNGALAMLEFSRAAEDAQYGLGGLINNIPTLLGYMGAGAGMAGIVSVVAVGLNVLFKAFNSNTEAADDYKKKLAETVDETTKAWKEAAKQETHVTAVAASYKILEDSLEKVNEKYRQQAAEIERAKEARDAENASNRQMDNAQSALGRAKIEQMEARGAKPAEIEAARHELNKEDTANKFARDQADLRSRQKAEEATAAAKAAEAKELEEQAKKIKGGGATLLNPKQKEALEEELKAEKARVMQLQDQIGKRSETLRRPTDKDLENGMQGTPEEVGEAMAGFRRGENVVNKRLNARDTAEMQQRAAKAAEIKAKLEANKVLQEGGGIQSKEDADQKAKELEKQARAAREAAAGAQARLGIIGGQMTSRDKVFGVEKETEESRHSAAERKNADKAINERMEQDEAIRKRQLESRFHPDNVKAAREERMKPLLDAAKQAGINTKKAGWGWRLKNDIEHGRDDDDDHDDAESPRGGRGASAGRRRIHGAVARDSYRRNRRGQVERVQATLSPNLKSRAEHAQAKQGAGLSKAEQQIIKLLGDLYKEARKQNNPKGGKPAA